MKANFLVALLFLAAIHVQAQTQIIAPPDQTPPQPDAASLGRYGDVPVSMDIGIPNINVPIYQLKTSRLSLPVSLNYYASGVKVDDVASWVGLGWSLNAGGVITRTVRGLDDFGTHGSFSNKVPIGDTLNDGNDWQYMDNVDQGLVDVEPDYFFYNFAGHTGKFVFDTAQNVLIVNYQDPVYLKYSGAGSFFTALDGSGNQYIFSNQENAESYYQTAETDPAKEHDMSYISAWYLTKIISFDRSDTISFSYTTDTQLSLSYNNYSDGVGNVYECTADGGLQNDGNLHDGNSIASQSHMLSSPLRLQEIDYKNGKIVFYSSGPRTDYSEVKLDSVKVEKYNYATSGYDVIKNVKFSYSYFVSTIGSGYGAQDRLRLDSLKELGGANESGGNYSFVYDSTMLPPFEGTAQDMFGYYNGKNTNISLIPRDTVQYEDATTFYVGGADRTTDPNYIQAGVLKRMYYPTGGYTDFAYECNQFLTGATETQGAEKSCYSTGNMREKDTTTFLAPLTTTGTLVVSISSFTHGDTIPYVYLKNVTTGTTLYNSGMLTGSALNYTGSIALDSGDTYQLITGAFQDDHIFAEEVLKWSWSDSVKVVQNGGGLRIKTITDRDYDGRFLKQEAYKYGVGENSIGYLPYQYFLFNTYSQEKLNYLGCLSTETSACTATTWKRLYFTGASIYDIFNLSSAPLSYSEVAKYQLDSLGNDIGKSVFDYSVYENTVIPGSQSYNTGPYVTNSGWAGGQLITQADYSNKGGIYYPVRKISHSYGSNPLPQGLGDKVGRTQQVSGCFATGPLGPITHYGYSYPVYTGSVLLGTEYKYDYDLNDTTKYITATQQFVYDNLTHLQPTRILTTMSDGTTIYNINRYPAEVDSISGLSAGQIAAIDSLQARHNITAIIQSQTFRDTTHVNLVRYDYKIWNSNLILPDSVEQQVSNYPIETRLQYSSYDSCGNILQDSRQNDVIHSYVWDYLNTRPIAEVANAASADIAFTSFEADGSGNWTIPSSTRDNSNALTGNSSYNLSNGNVTKSGLTAGTSYVVSYWSKSGSSYTVSGSSSTKQGKTIGGWTYFEHTVSGVTSVTVSGSNDIDELRLYPQSAQMKTYTYNPMVGVNTYCDIDNRVTYYYYDGLARLKYIKDQDGNIIKTIDYHFKGQSN